MSKSSFEKWLVTLALLIVIGAMVFHLVKSDREPQSQRQRRLGAQSDFAESYDFHPYYLPSVPRPTNGAQEQIAGIAKLPREKVEAWLVEHHRGAISLLAAFRALNDTNYLNEAATNFPNNPQVELAVLARDEFPADRRKWLDLFKESSPSNSLANYLSAQDYLQNGNTDAAIQELLAATGKSQFENYVNESQLDTEALAQFCGESPVKAFEIALGSFYGQEEASELATLKRLAFSMGDLQKQEAAVGDTASVQSLAQMGMVLANQLTSSGGGKMLINQLVGIADEAIVLSQLDQNTGYDFLGGQTPAQVLQQNQLWKASIRELIPNFQAAYLQLTEAEKLDYLERMQENGEVEAMRWLVQQHPPSNP